MHDEPDQREREQEKRQQAVSECVRNWRCVELVPSLADGTGWDGMGWGMAMKEKERKREEDVIKTERKKEREARKMLCVRVCDG